MVPSGGALVRAAWRHVQLKPICAFRAVYTGICPSKWDLKQLPEGGFNLFHKNRIWSDLWVFRPLSRHLVSVPMGFWLAVWTQLQPVCSYTVNSVLNFKAPSGRGRVLRREQTSPELSDKTVWQLWSEDINNTGRLCNLLTCTSLTPSIGPMKKNKRVWPVVFLINHPHH